MPATPDNTTRTARIALEQICSGHDLDGVERVYHPDFVDHVNRSIYHGQDGVRSSVDFYQRILADLQFTVHEQVTDGSKVASRFTMRGTNHGRQVELGESSSVGFRMAGS